MRESRRRSIWLSSANPVEKEFENASSVARTSAAATTKKWRRESGAAVRETDCTAGTRLLFRFIALHTNSFPGLAGPPFFGRGGDALDRDADQLRRVHRPVSPHAPVADPVRHVQPGNYFSRNRIFSRPLRQGIGGDKELTPPRIRRSSVGNRQFPRAVEPQAGQELVGDGDPAIVRPGGGRIARLDHDARQHSMKNQVVVQRTLHHRAGFRIFPWFRSLRERDKVTYRDRSFFFIKTGDDDAIRGLKRRVQARL